MYVIEWEGDGRQRTSKGKRKELLNYERKNHNWDIKYILTSF